MDDGIFKSGRTCLVGGPAGRYPVDVANRGTGQADGEGLPAAEGSARQG
jgi:hypothetical protein